MATRTLEPNFTHQNESLSVLKKHLPPSRIPSVVRDFSLPLFLLSLASRVKWFKAMFPKWKQFSEKCLLDKSIVVEIYTYLHISREVFDS